MSQRIDQPAEQGPLAPAPVARVAKMAAEFGEDNTHFLWGPYLPIGDYTVVMADGGTGKTIWCCGVAAAISAGRPLPGSGEEGTNEEKNVLFISAEDSGEILKARLSASCANLDRIFILDRDDSQGMNLVEDYAEFEATVLSYKPDLIIIDPWHAFLGPTLNLNKVNAVRPILQRFANLAKKCGCAMILVSHVNKRSQGENANNAATGSADFINAARSACRIIFDDGESDSRIMVHTKSNYAASGPSLCYRITEDGGLEWTGVSPITKWTLEEAARRRSTPGKTIQYTQTRESINQKLIEALKLSVNQTATVRYSYDEFKAQNGDFIFGGLQPKRALNAVADLLAEDGYFVRPCSVRRNGKTANGFLVQKMDTTDESE